MPYLPLTGQTTTSSSSPRYYNQSYAPENGLNKTGSSSQYNHSYPSAPEVPQGDQSIPPPQASSNTYRTSQSGNHSNWSLPSGWKVAYRNNDGRMYYFELVTGKTTWNHPSAPSFPAQDGGNVEQETPMTAFKRPDSHQCCTVLSCLVFPPLGIFALMHSIMTYRSWNQGNYGVNGRNDTRLRKEIRRNDMSIHWQCIFGRH